MEKNPFAPLILLLPLSADLAHNNIQFRVISYRFDAIYNFIFETQFQILSSCLAAMVSTWKRPALAKAAGVILIAYFCALIPLRYYAQGTSALFELLWGCNVALLLCGVGCLLHNPILIGSSIALVAFPHLSWCAYFSPKNLLVGTLQGANSKILFYRFTP